jgi:hypothetical protein
MSPEPSTLRAVAGQPEMEHYKARLRSLVTSLSGLVPPDALQAAASLVEHNEAGEALLLIAHVIVEEKIDLPRAVIREMHELGDWAVGDEWPEGFAADVSP